MDIEPTKCKLEYQFCAVFETGKKWCADSILKWLMGNMTSSNVARVFALEVLQIQKYVSVNIVE